MRHLHSIGLLVIGAGCGDNLSASMPDAAEFQFAWESVSIEFSGSNNPHDNALCRPDGTQDIAVWVGRAVATLAGRTDTVMIGASSQATDRHLAWTECFDDEGRCADDATTPTTCELRFFAPGTSPDGRYQESQFIVRVPAALWRADQPIDLASPSTDPTAYAFGIVAIDGNRNGVIDRDTIGVIAPDIEAFAGVVVEGVLALAAAGIRDREPVTVDVATTLTLAGAP